MKKKLFTGLAVGVMMLGMVGGAIADDSITVKPIDHENGTCGNRVAKFYATYNNRVIAVYYSYDMINKYARKDSLPLKRLQVDLCSHDNERVRLHENISIVGKWKGRDEDDPKIDAFEAKRISLTRRNGALDRGQATE